MPEITPHNSPIVFPSPLQRSRGPIGFAALAVVLAVAAVVAWQVTSDAVSDASGASAPRAAGSASVETALGRAPGPPTPRLAPVDAAVRAFEAAQFDSSVTVLRLALRERGADSLRGPQRARALTYLAAAELQRGRRDSSDAAFRQLLREHPRSAPDPSLFPRDVIARYQRVRAALHGVARIRTTPTGVALLVVAFNAHRAGVGVRAADGKPLMTLYDGVVKDSVLVAWDGTGPDGALVPLGSYDLVLIAFARDGGIANAVSFPVVMAQPDAAERARPRSVESPATPAAGDVLRGHGGQLMPQTQH